MNKDQDPYPTTGQNQKITLEIEIIQVFQIQVPLQIKAWNTQK